MRLLCFIFLNCIGKICHGQHGENECLNSAYKDTECKPAYRWEWHPDWHQSQQNDDENLTCKNVTEKTEGQGYWLCHFLNHINDNERCNRLKEMTDIVHSLHVQAQHMYHYYDKKCQSQCGVQVVCW